jgi:hypothetical protein
MLVLLVSFRPNDPSINTHDGVIEINRSFPDQLTLNTDIDIDDRVDQPYRVKPDILKPAEINTRYTAEHGEVFIPGSIMDIVKKLPPDFR